MFEGIKHKLLISVGLGALVFLGFSLLLDFGQLAGAFERFDWRYLPAALGLALLNYLFRFIRWHLFLGELGICLPLADSAVVFLAGLVMSVTPGKAGELMKAYLIRYRLETPLSQSVPAILAERLGDIISLILLAFLGIFSFQTGAWALAAGAAGIALLVLFLGRPGAVFAVLRAVEALPLAGRLAAPLAGAYGGMRVLVSPRNLLAGVGLGLVAWFAECLGLHLVLLGFGLDVGVVQATFIYSFATLFGAATMLPGGLGSTEGSMSGLLVLRGVPLPDAVAATFVIRVCTLWFAVALGAAGMLHFRNRFGEGSGELTGEQGVQER